ncbi:MAG: hypothetical protein WBW93_02750 [Steroidobacteraceae bacterium]
MRAIPVTPQTVDVARRIIWFEEPEKALAEPVRFMAYAMTYARHEDMRVIRQYVSDEEIRQALDTAPPGIIDPRSWAYWNLRMGRFPPPLLRKRTFDKSRPLQPTATLSLEERRRAVQEWRAKYRPEKKQ